MNIFEVYKPNTSASGWVNFGLDPVTTEDDALIAQAKLIEDVAFYFPGITNGLGITANGCLMDEVVIDRAIEENPFGLLPFGGRYAIDATGNVQSVSFGQTPVSAEVLDPFKLDIAV